jgi:hypothetical protein
MPTPTSLCRISAVIAAFILGAFPCSKVWAGDPLGLYLSGSIGQSEMGANVSYFDLGRPSGSFASFPADMTTTGAAAFGIVYLPIPLPAFDFNAKAGAARLQSKLNSTNSRGALPLICTVEFGCGYEPGPFPISRADRSFRRRRRCPIQVGLVCAARRILTLQPVQ